MLLLEKGVRVLVAYVKEQVTNISPILWGVSMHFFSFSFWSSVVSEERVFWICCFSCPLSIYIPIYIYEKNTSLFFSLFFSFFFFSKIYNIKVVDCQEMNIIFYYKLQWHVLSAWFVPISNMQEKTNTAKSWYFELLVKFYMERRSRFIQEHACWTTNNPL